MTNTDDNNPKNTGALFILVLVTAPLYALLDAWACSTIWRWFVARDLGPGLSFAAWFGIGVLISLLITHPASRKTGKTPSTMRAVEASLTHPVFTLCAVGLSAFVGKIVGWF